MANKDTSRRQRLSGNIKSAIATAAVVGTLGGWVAFGSQQAATAETTTVASAPAVAQVAEIDSTTAQSSSKAPISNDSAAETTSNSSAAQSSSTSSDTSSSSTNQDSTASTGTSSQTTTQPQVVTRTRSSG